MSSVVTKPAIPTSYYTEDAKFTVKLFCKQRAGIQDVMMLLRAHGIKPEHVKSACTGQPGDPAIYIGFTDREPVTVLQNADKLSYRDFIFNVVPLDSQVITLRIHWLPLYIGDSFIKRVFSEYGKVVDLERQTFRNLETGLRIVRLEVDEARRLALPHLIKFECGTSMLITVQGRPPLCLRCQRVGHVRRECPQTPTYFSGNNNRSQEPPTLPLPQQQRTQQPQRPLEEKDEGEKEGNEQPVSQVQQQPPTESLQPDGEQQLDLESSEGSIVSDNLVIDENPQIENNENVEDENVEMEIPPPSLKRNLGEDGADSFPEHFPPQKVVKQNTIDVRNRYEVLQDLTSLLDDV